MLDAIPADRLARFESSALVSGIGHDEGATGCAMQWADYLARGASHWSDTPDCVDPAIRRLMIRLNDRLGQEDRQKLKPYILRSLGTNVGEEMTRRRAWIAVDHLHRTTLPIMLETAGLGDLAQQLRALPEIVGRATADAAKALREEARKAALARRYESIRRYEAKTGKKWSWTAAYAADAADADAADAAYADAAYADADADAAADAAYAAAYAAAGAADAAADGKHKAKWTAAREQIAQSNFALLDRLISVSAS